MPQKHQQLMKSSLQKNQDHASNVINDIFRTGTWSTKVTPKENSRTTRKPIVVTSTTKKLNIAVSFLHVLYPFQEPQQIKPGDDISLSVSTIKHFLGGIGEKYTFQKKSNTSLDAPTSQHVTVKEVMENITKMDDKQTDTAESVHKSADDAYLLNLFYQYSDLLSSTSDWLSKDIAVVINEASS